jgi:hypothetical protein
MTASPGLKSPSVVPPAAGHPCWALDDVARAVPQIAQLDESRSHYFLASHTPIQGLLDERTRRVLGEEELYQSITDAAYGDVLALVHGDPGTGKSHLIHWLNLRLRHALETGEAGDVVRVLVQRRTGSLRDALDQLVQQLPAEFAHYTASIRQAIEHISAETARQQLANELRLELGVRRPDRGRAPLAGLLRNLHETVGSPGFREWLSREGGPIDRNIRRLNARSEVEERESFPPFTARDFLVEDARFKGDNTPAVRRLIDDLEDEPELRDRAAEHFNAVLPDALREVTGLSGTTLRELFDRIRADLRAQGRILAVFVEDVSVMSALDQDVVNVFEPQGRDDLCRTIAVVGLTGPGLRKLRENQRQRATHEIAVGRGVGVEWTEDAGEVARFAGRYLNTLRLREDDVREVARGRRAGGALKASACDGCPVRKECHDAFGMVEVDGLHIGTFPFSPAAPQRLVQRLDQSSDGVRRNPRGLLMHVVHPVVGSHAALQEGRFPSLHLAVEPPSLPFWAAFEDRFCGGWSLEQKSRLKLLAQFWVQADGAEEAAVALQPFLAPLGFPGFTAAVAQSAAGAEAVRQAEPRERTSAPVRERVSPTRAKLDQLLADLDRWMGGEELQRPNDARQFLSALVREGIRWSDQRDVPPPLAREMLKGYEWVDIEGMRLKLKNASAFSIRFERSRETRDLVEALAQYAWTGGGSWNFEHGELHKRRVASWLRRNRGRMIEALHPRGGVDRQAPVRAAIQFLAAASLVARRARLPAEVDRRMAAVLAPPPEQLPAGLSPQWLAALTILFAHQARVRTFLLDELTVPQGTGGINFIDPLPLVRTLSAFDEAPGVEPLDELCFGGFWQSRYAALEPLEKLGALDRLALVERVAVAERVDSVRAVLEGWEYGGEVGEAAREFFADLGEVLEVQKRAEVFTSTSLFPDLGPRQLADAAKRWARAAAEADSVAGSGDAVDALLFDPAPLRELGERLAEAAAYLQRVEKVVHEEMEDIRFSGDPDEAAAALLETLDRIAAADAPEPVEAP